MQPLKNIRYKAKIYIKMQKYSVTHINIVHCYKNNIKSNSYSGEKTAVFLFIIKPLAVKNMIN